MRLQISDLFGKRCLGKNTETGGLTQQHRQVYFGINLREERDQSAASYRLGIL
jgi:hypothetical protein